MNKLMKIEERDECLKKYFFTCKKANDRHREVYIKTYEFITPQTFYDTFDKCRYNHNFQFNTFSKKDACEIECQGFFTTKKMKDGKIVPILRISRLVKPKIGSSLVKEDDEALELLTDAINTLESQYDEIIKRKYENDISALRVLVSRLAEKDISENDERILKLREEEQKYYQKALKIDTQIRELKDSLYSQSLYNICKEIKKNDYEVPNRAFKDTCNDGYIYEKEAIINVVVENLTHLKTKKL